MSFKRHFFFQVTSALLHVPTMVVAMKMTAHESGIANRSGHSLNIELVSSVKMGSTITSNSKVKNKTSEAQVAHPASASPSPVLQNAQGFVSGPQTAAAVTLPVAYPEISRVRGEEGMVKLRVAVDHLGQIEEVIVLKSSGFQRLDNEAMRAARKLAGAEPGEREFNVQFKLDDLP